MNKRITFSSLLLLLAAWIGAQSTISVSGTVTKIDDGSPVSGWLVYAYAFDPNDTMQFTFNLAYTEQDGTYALDLDLPSGATDVNVFTSTGCYNGLPSEYIETYPIANGPVSANFEICAEQPPVQNCYAYFDALADSTDVQFYGYYNTNDSSAMVVSWFWDFGDGNTSTEQNPTHAYAQEGYYNVHLTVTGSDSCIATYATTIYAGGPQWPECWVWFHISAVDSLGILFTPEYYSLDSSAVATYFWSFGDGATSTEATPTHTYAQSGAYTVTLTVVSASGCEATITYLIHVGAQPPSPQCFGWADYFLVDTLSFQFVPQYFAFDSATVVSYFWDFGDGNTSTEAQPIHTYAASGFYTATLTVVGSTGCESEYVFFVYTDIPPTPQCFGYINGYAIDTLSWQFEAVAFDLTGSLVNLTDYQWDFGDGNTSTEATPVHTYAAEGVYTVVLNAMTQDSCPIQNAISIFVGDSHIDTFFYGCQAMFYVALGQDSLGYQFTDVSMGNPVSWHWDFGDGNTSTEQNPYHVYDQPGVYLAKLAIVAADGCESTIPFLLCVGNNCGWSQEHDCQALFIPLPDSIGSLTFQFVDLSFSNYGITSWNWNFGDGNTSTDQFPIHTYDQPGEYKVTLQIAGDSCESEIIFWVNTGEPWNFGNRTATLGSALNTVSTTAIPVAFQEIRLAPNPATDLLQLFFSSENNQPYQIRILDMTGRLVLEQRGTTLTGLNAEVLPVGDLNAGMYLLELSNAREMSVQKFVKQ